MTTNHTKRGYDILQMQRQLVRPNPSWTRRLLPYHLSALERLAVQGYGSQESASGFFAPQQSQFRSNGVHFFKERKRAKQESRWRSSLSSRVIVTRQARRRNSVSHRTLYLSTVVCVVMNMFFRIEKYKLTPHDLRHVMSVAFWPELYKISMVQRQEQE